MSPGASELLLGSSQGVGVSWGFPEPAEGPRGHSRVGDAQGIVASGWELRRKTTKRGVCSVSAAGAVPSLPSGVTGRSWGGAGRALGPCRGWEWTGGGPAVPWVLPGGFAAVNRDGRGRDFEEM